MTALRSISVLSFVALAACVSSTPATDAGGVDAGGVDAGHVDAGGVDAGHVDAGSADAGCVPCTHTTVSWGENGGLVAYTDRSTLTSCTAFSFVRTAGAVSTMGSCSNALVAGCAASGIGGGDVERALEHPDVVAALAAAPVLYGRDTRPVDGSVLQIQVDGKLIEVGLDCMGASGCAPVPAGVLALSLVLGDVTTQQLRVPDCTTVFPDGG